MANRLSKEKANLIASNYMTNGLKKVQALLDAGYSVTYSNNVGLKLFDNERVKAEIAVIQARSVVLTDYTVTDCDNDYKRVMEASEANKQFSTASTCITGRARLRGWDKNSQVTTESPVNVDQADLELIEEQARAALRLV